MNSVRPVGHRRPHFTWLTCERLRRRLLAWQDEQRRNSHGLAEFAEAAIEAICKEMGRYNCG